LTALVGEGYFLSGGNLYSLLNGAIYDDTGFEFAERPHMTRAIEFVAWSMQYWWVYLLGSIGLVALIVAITLLIADKRHWVVWVIGLIALAMVIIAITLGVRL